MWSRIELKTRAKEILRQNYWRAFLVSLILALVGAGISGSGGNSGRNSNQNRHRQSNEYVEQIGEFGTTSSIESYSEQIVSLTDRLPFNFGITPFSAIISGFLAILGLGIFMLTIFFMLFKLLLGYGLGVGGARYFIDTFENPRTDFHGLTLAFRDGNYFNILITMFLRGLYTFLWTLLLIIPGIVKRYAYLMVPYILADNPKMHHSRALELSQRMMLGHKMSAFILQLSFIGWYILGALIPFGIGKLFVYPYENTTFAGLYLVLRENAINQGYTDYDELNLYNVTIEDIEDRRYN